MRANGMSQRAIGEVLDISQAKIWRDGQLDSNVQMSQTVPADRFEDRPHLLHVRATKGRQTPNARDCGWIKALGLRLASAHELRLRELVLGRKVKTRAGETSQLSRAGRLICNSNLPQLFRVANKFFSPTCTR
jgi:hypothetical protein